MLTISLDIETYGIADWLPSQKETAHNGRFIPERSIHLDVPRHQLIVSAAITFIDNFSWDREGLRRMTPGDTMTFSVQRLDHREALLAWWNAADVVLGMNIQFDIRYLRAFDRRFRNARPRVIDLSVLSYLDNELRPERSLKTIGKVLGTHDYEASAQTHTWPTIEPILQYNAEDSHNTVLAAQAVVEHTCRNPEPGGKFSPECLDFYSGTIWSTLIMCENGVPLHVPSLRSLEKLLLLKIERSERVCSHQNLQLSGPGSNTSRLQFIDRVIDAIDEEGDTSKSARDHELLERTEKTQVVSFKEGNRSLLASLLPDRHPLQRPLRAWTIHSKSQKLLSSYIYPLLHHRRNHPNDRSSILVPQGI